MTTFIATLGRSPGAVTGLYFDLIRSNIVSTLDQVYLFGTQDDDARESERIVTERLTAFRKDIQIFSIPLDETEFHQAEAFQKIITHYLRIASERGPVYVGITGGQTGMGAMLAISAQIYRNVALYHYWVHDTIGAVGSVRDLNALKRAKNHERYELILDPGADQKKSYSRIIPLPTLRAETARNAVEQARTLDIAHSPALNPHEANAILRLLPRRMTVEQALAYTALLGEIYDGADPLDKLNDVVSVLNAAGITNIRGYLLDLLRHPGDDPQPQILQDWVNRIVLNNEYWAEGLQQTYKKFNYNAEVQLLRLGTRAALVGTAAAFVQALIMLAQHLKL